MAMALMSRLVLDEFEIKPTLLISAFDLFYTYTVPPASIQQPSTLNDVQERNLICCSSRMIPPFFSTLILWAIVFPLSPELTPA